jgi:hypothetical protein
MKEQIINILGKNHKSIEFDLVDGFYGLYTYRGEVYVFKDGWDIPYTEIDSKTQKKILDIIISKKWKIKRSL